MLELESVRFKNFLSFGDYWTEFPLTNLGQCLITGKIINSDDNTVPLNFIEQADKASTNNGAGKSSATNAILWGLFGRTMHSSNPGERVVNWYTGGDCVVDLKFKSGDQIIRTRTSNKTELFYIKAGNEQSLTADTVSTTKYQQSLLAKEFGLDWEIFCGSVFFSQYSRPWMEMPDALRKSAMERILHVDRFNLYGEVAGEKAVKVEGERGKCRLLLNGIDISLKSVAIEIDNLTVEKAKFESNRTIRQQLALTEHAEAITSRNTIILPDLVKLSAQWSVVEQIEAKIRTNKEEATKLRRMAANVQNEANAKEFDAQCKRRLIVEWKQKDGKLCLVCEQAILSEHVSQKISPLIKETECLDAEASKIQANATMLLEQAKALEGEAEQVASKLIARRPKLTVNAAESLHRDWQYWDRAATRAKERADDIAQEGNPLGSGIANAQARKLELEAQQLKFSADVSNYDVAWNHYNYVSKSYSDRRKIKTYIFNRYIPFINARLNHYLELFEVDIAIAFTDTLGIKSDKWGYDFFSGGERKRTDLALMLAIFDLHERMYGRQCNVMVLDEVDSRMDAKGIDALVQIIKSDLANKVETVFIISHKSQLYDIFPRQIVVKRKDRFSYIEELR